MLYHPLILKLNKNPHHFHKLESADYIIKAYNPLCGDQFTIYLQMDGEVIQEAAFHGYGCAVSKASTSMLVQKLEGRKLEDFKGLMEELELVVGEADTGLLQHEDLKAFEQVRDFAGRISCVRLGWDALRDSVIGDW